ncbi:hypothetical protein V5799_007552 [Amblyomma americanum]|uniref:Uncharacterized protein n=1 Tax=Amblyomma americanum TaxID=6943 RepID=A0AAQ4FHF6_AMBAM
MLRNGAADDGSAEPLQPARNGDLLRAYQEDPGFEMPSAPLPPPPPLPLPPPVHEAEPDSSLLQHGNGSLPEIRAPFAVPDDDSLGQPRKGSADSSQSSTKCRRRTKSMTCNMVSALYGKIAVVVTTVLVLTEVMDNTVPLLRFHGYLYAYLLGGSVVCLLGVYVSTMVDRCPSLTGQSHSGDPEVALRRGRVMTPCSDISIYLRIGVIVFGLGTLLSSGLEIATIFTLSKPCTDPVNLGMPVLHALFTFLQMHFVFMNAQSVARSLGCLRHLVLVHLVVTNIAVWLKLLLWETASEWLRQSHVVQGGENIWPPKGFNFTTHVIDDQGDHKAFFTSDCLWRPIENLPMERMLTLQRCLHNSTVGAIWQKASPFLTPFIVQYSVVAAVVVYTIWDNYSYCTRGKNHCGRRSSPTADRIEAAASSSSRIVDCQGSSKGLFLGLLVLVAGIIVLILFFVLSSENMEIETLSAVTTLHCAVQGLSAFATAIGLCRVGGAYHKRGRATQLNSILQGIGLLAVYTYGIFGVVAGASRVLQGSEHLLLLLDGAFMVLFASLQSLFVQRLAMRCLPKKNGKSGLQVVTFLMFSNLVLWLLETFTSQNHISSQQQLAMYGDVSWGIISRVALPLVIFYRFHSCVFVLEAWQLPINLSRE